MTTSHPKPEYAADESMWSVCYRTGSPTIEDYDEAIDELQRAKVDLRWKRDGFAIPTCFVCEDSGHTAAGCHHNPLLLAKAWARATEVWQCWHCGFIATNAEEAQGHFGKSDDEPAECQRVGWRPIETAPQDGTVVDLWQEEFGRYANCYWGMPQHCCGEAGSYCDSEWHGLSDGWIDSTLNEHAGDGFTHWMPLPVAPKAEA